MSVKIVICGLPVRITGPAVPAVGQNGAPSLKGQPVEERGVPADVLTWPASSSGAMCHYLGWLVRNATDAEIVS